MIDDGQPEPADRARVATLVAAQLLAADVTARDRVRRVVRTTLVTVRLGERLGVDPAVATTAYWTCLLAGLGGVTRAVVAALDLDDEVRVALTSAPSPWQQEPSGDRDAHPVASAAVQLAAAGSAVAAMHDEDDDLVVGIGTAGLRELVAAEPRPWAVRSGVRLDEALAGLGDRADLAGRGTSGHARAVASLAGAAADAAGLAPEGQRALRQAGWVHDLGRGITAPGTPPDHARQPDVGDGMVDDLTRSVLGRVPVMADVATLVAAARTPQAPHRSTCAELLAAAHRYVALGEADGHGPARCGAEAADDLREAARAGHLAVPAVDAVLRAAGHAPVSEPGRPGGGLTPREGEVLRLIARGATAGRVGRELSITEKTASNHITRIYTKLGISSRAEAVLFAVRHGLLPTLLPLDVHSDAAR